MKIEKPKLISVTLIGGCYRSGVYQSGWASARLSDNTTIYVPEAQASFNGAINFVKDKSDVKEYTKRLYIWMKTGTMPPSKYVLTPA